MKIVVAFLTFSFYITYISSYFTAFTLKTNFDNEDSQVFLDLESDAKTLKQNIELAAQRKNAALKVFIGECNFIEGDLSIALSDSENDIAQIESKFKEDNTKKMTLFIDYQKCVAKNQKLQKTKLRAKMSENKLKNNNWVDNKLKETKKNIKIYTECDLSKRLKEKIAIIKNINSRFLESLNVFSKFFDEAIKRLDIFKNKAIEDCSTELELKIENLKQSYANASVDIVFFYKDCVSFKDFVEEKVKEILETCESILNNYKKVLMKCNEYEQKLC